MIAQLSDSSEVHKLHVNQSMDLQTPVTVQVEESGVYLITIIPITEEAGIVGSGVEEVLVDITTLSIASGNTGSTTGTVCVCIHHTYVHLLRYNYRMRVIFGGRLVWRLLSYIQLAGIIIGGP